MIDLYVEEVTAKTLELIKRDKMITSRTVVSDLIGKDRERVRQICNDSKEITRILELNREFVRKVRAFKALTDSFCYASMTGLSMTKGAYISGHDASKVGNNRQIFKYDPKAKDNKFVKWVTDIPKASHYRCCSIRDNTVYVGVYEVPEGNMYSIINKFLGTVGVVDKLDIRYINF